MTDCKKDKVPLIFIILFIISVIINYIFINPLQKSFGYKETKNKSEEIIKNTKNMDKKDLENMNYFQLNELAQFYYAQDHLDRSKEIALIVIQKNPKNRQALNLLSAIAEMQFNFEESIKYSNILLPDSEGEDLFNLYLHLANLYLTKDIDMSIDYLEKAVVFEKDNSSILVLRPEEVENISNKLNFLKDIRPLLENEDPVEFYKAILNDTEYYISDEIKKYLYEEYKEEHSEKYTDSFNELNKIYKDKIEPNL